MRQHHGSFAPLCFPIGNELNLLARTFVHAKCSVYDCNKLHIALLIFSDLTSQFCMGNPGAATLLPSHPPAIIATAYNKAPEPGKYGVGTRTPPTGIPTSSNWNNGCRSHSMAFSESPLRAADIASIGKSQLPRECEPLNMPFTSSRYLPPAITDIPSRPDLLRRRFCQVQADVCRLRQPPVQAHQRRMVIRVRWRVPEVARNPLVNRI